MKKKLFTLAAAMGACSILMAGTGSAATLEEVMEGYKAANQNVSSVSADMDLNLQVSLSMSSETSGTSTMAMGVVGDMKMAALMDPLSMSMDGTIKVDAMGVGQEMAMKMYMVPSQDGSELEMYTYMSEDGVTGEWDYESTEMPNMEEFTKAMEELNFDLDQLPGTVSLGEDTQVNGTDCYQLLYSMNYEDLKPVIDEAMKASGEELGDEDAAMVEAILSGLVFNMAIDLNKENYQPLKMHLDMNGSDLSMFNQILAYSMAGELEEGMTAPEVSLDITDLYIDAIYDYSTPVEITVPEEAILAVKTGNDVNVSSVQ